MDRQPMLIRNIILNMFPDMCRHRRHATMRPIRTRTGNMGMNGATSTITTTIGMGTITTTISLNSKITSHADAAIATVDSRFVL